MDTLLTFIQGLSFASFILLGLYMLFAKNNAFGKTNTNPFLCKMTGINLIMWSISVLLELIFSHFHAEDGFNFRQFSQLLNFFLIAPAGLMLAALVQYPRIKWKQFFLLHIFPFLLLILYCLTELDIFYQLSVLYWILDIIHFIIKFNIKKRKYIRLLKDNFLDLENRELQWITTFSIIFGGYLIIYFIALSLNEKFFLCESYLLGLLAWFYIVWNVGHQENIVNFWPENNITDTDNNPSESQSPSMDWIGKRLEEKCKDEKLYLQPDINMTTLCQHIGTNRTYLSLYFKLNKLTQADIARQSGFNSLNSFRRVYTSITEKQTL